MPHQAHLQQDKTLRTKQAGMMSFYIGIIIETIVTEPLLKRSIYKISLS